METWIHSQNAKHILYFTIIIAAPLYCAKLYIQHGFPLFLRQLIDQVVRVNRHQRVQGFEGLRQPRDLLPVNAGAVAADRQFSLVACRHCQWDKFVLVNSAHEPVCVVSGFQNEILDETNAQLGTVESNCQSHVALLVSVSGFPRRGWSGLPFRWW
jgi:hypothetical protein